MDRPTQFVCFFFCRPAPREEVVTRVRTRPSTQAPRSPVVWPRTRGSGAEMICSNLKEEETPMKARILFVIVIVLALVLPVAPAAFAQSGETVRRRGGGSDWPELVGAVHDRPEPNGAGTESVQLPRDNRGLAISPDGKFLYLGYNNALREVRKIDLSKADYTDATVARTTVSRGKAIAVDDQGRVYLADGGAITDRRRQPHRCAVHHHL